MTEAPIAGELLCPIHQVQAVLRDSASIYGGISYGMIWICPEKGCNCYVGCHGDSAVPKGTLATPSMRRARKRCHAVFDALWRGSESLYEIREKGKAKSRVIKRLRRSNRGRCYAWLAYQLQIDIDDCHIAMFDVTMCERAIMLLKSTTMAQIRDWNKETRGGKHAEPAY